MLVYIEINMNQDGEVLLYTIAFTNVVEPYQMLLF